MYQAEVVTPQSKETYIGLCDTSFKECYRDHTYSFKNEQYKNVTELNKYIRSVKKNGKSIMKLNGEMYGKLDRIQISTKDVICAYGRNFL